MNKKERATAVKLEEVGFALAFQTEKYSRFTNLDSYCKYIIDIDKNGEVMKYFIELNHRDIYSGYEAAKIRDYYFKLNKIVKELK